MDLALVNLPSPFIEDQRWIYPLGILQVATYAASIGHSVEVVDLAGVDDWESRVADIEADVIGVSAVTPQFDALARIPDLTSVRLIAGGVHPTLFPDETIALGYDAVVVGEGEYMLEAALRIDGVLECREFVDIDSLKPVDRSFLSGYRGPAPIMAGRGCPYRCAFCAQIPGLSRFRFRSAEAVADELETIAHDDVIFYDDTFTANRKWLARLCGEIIRRGIKKRFRCSTRADKIDDETAGMLVSAGFTEVCIGVESGSQKILDTIGKRSTPATNMQAVHTCRRHGLRVKAFIMVGNPGETHQTLAETEAWIADAQPDQLGIYIFNPLPGCDIYDHPERYDIRFDKANFADRYYGGHREKMESRVSTSGLTADQITRWYDRLSRFRRTGF